ncbi:hypothetical protein HMH01_04395 [Halovulum dunhuangense]|uniref:Uncharacterized protein n=1 Tax=Halovulum dunhuangense TaxID=1505036 RepID=A0A849KWM7_9RHOB|nr:hypothetical protein [Halovulum dunhuangense]NNU79675.1 hypothetical protein [Halovulum dunhuangense]
MIRPKAIATLSRWSEPAIYAGAGAVGALLLVRGVQLGGWLVMGFGAGIVALSALAGLAWYRRTRFQGGGTGAGLVEIDERRVGYLGPEGGGFVDLDALSRLDLLTPGDPGDAVWVLTHDDGLPLRIPLGARGAGRLVDVFSALPGIRMDAALAALEARRAQRVAVWRRSLP